MAAYDKLVRDGIPAKIEEKRETCRWHTADPAEMPQRLCAKLIEEVGELTEVLGTDADKAEEELADVLEVAEALAGRCRVDLRELRARDPYNGRRRTHGETVLAYFAMELARAAASFVDTLARDRLMVDLSILFWLLDALVASESKPQHGLRFTRVQFVKADKWRRLGGFEKGIILDEA